MVSTIVGWYMKHFVDLEGDIPQMARKAYRMGASQPKLLFLGKGDGTFEDISKNAGSAITSPRMGRGAAFADYDGDGRIDVAVTNKNQMAQVLLNRFVLPEDRNWVIFELRAPAPNVFAVGARLQVTSGDRTFTREVQAGTSYLSADDLAVHVGLGTSGIDQVLVRWPDGAREVFENVPANRRLRLEKGSGRPASPTTGAAADEVTGSG